MTYYAWFHYLIFLFWNMKKNNAMRSKKWAWYYITDFYKIIYCFIDNQEEKKKKRFPDEFCSNSRYRCTWLIWEANSSSLTLKLLSNFIRNFLFATVYKKLKLNFLKIIHQSVTVQLFNLFSIKFFIEISLKIEFELDLNIKQFKKKLTKPNINLKKNYTKKVVGWN